MKRYLLLLIILSNSVSAGFLDKKLNLYQCINEKESRRCLLENQSCTALKLQIEFKVNDKNKTVMVTEFDNKGDESFLLKNCDVIDSKNWECNYENKLKKETITMASGKVQIRSLYFNRDLSFSCAR